MLSAFCTALRSRRDLVLLFAFLRGCRRRSLLRLLLGGGPACRGRGRAATRGRRAFGLRFALWLRRLLGFLLRGRRRAAGGRAFGLLLGLRRSAARRGAAHAEGGEGLLVELAVGREALGALEVLQRFLRLGPDDAVDLD